MPHTTQTFQTSKQSAEQRKIHNFFLLILAASFLLHTVLSLTSPGFETDVNCFGAWSESLLKLGPSQFYTAGFFADYPPGYLYYLWLTAWINDLLGFSPFYGMGLYFLTLLPILCNLALAYIGFRITLRHQSSKAALFTGTLIAFLPPMLYDAAVWKQADSVFILALVLCFLALDRKKWYGSAVIYGMALLIKPQALFWGPVLAVGFLLPLFTQESRFQSPSANSKRFQMGPEGRLFSILHLQNRKIIVLIRAALCAFLSLGTIWLGSLPFRGSQPRGWLFHQYLSSTTTYPYASVNGFNLFAGLGGNWASWDTSWIFSYKTWGTLLLCLATLLLFWAAWARRDHGNGNIFLLCAFYGMAVFTLGHGMHERYSLPALIFLLLAWACTGQRKLLYFSFGQCICSFLNIVMAYKLLENGSLMGNSIFTYMIRLIGLSQTTLFVFFLFYCFPVSAAKPYMKAGKLIKQKLSAAIPIKTFGSRADRLADKVSHYPVSPWCRKDTVSIIAVTLLGAAVSFSGLGDTKSPQTAWTAPAKQVELTPDQPASTVWVYGGIGTDTLSFTDEDGNVLIQVDMEQGNLFNWAVYQLPQHKGSLLLTAQGNATVYELVFTGPDGKTIPVTVSQGGELLVDEQRLRPKYIGPMSGMYFDEIYHGRTAYEYLRGLEPYETTHPPLGKELIGIGISLFGMTPFGWRFVGTLFGVFMLPLIYFLARLLTGQPRFGLLASVLLGLDFMRFTQSRIATIDVYAVFFIMLSFLGMLLWLRMDLCKTPLSRQLSALGLSGLGFGLSCAVKWTGVYAGGGLAVMFFLSLWRSCRERKDIADAHDSPLFKRRCMILLGSCVFLFVLLPLLLYACSYLFYFSRSGKSFSLEELWTIQKNMFNYHSGLVATHPFASRCFSWPIIGRPVWYSMASLLPQGMAGSIAVLGNPAIWWTGFLALMILAAIYLFKSRDRNIMFLIIAYACQFIPWMFIDRLQFLYHYFGCVPILVLSIVYLLYRISGRYPRTSIYAGWGISAAVFVLFTMFFPVLSGLVVSSDYLSWLKWFPTWIF